MARSKAYLFRGVEIRWRCDPALLEPGRPCRPRRAFISRKVSPTSSRRCTAGASSWSRSRSPARPRSSTVPASSGRSPGRSTRSPMPDGTAIRCRRLLGGTHEAGLRAALLKGLRTHAERIGFRRAARSPPRTRQGGACRSCSLFLRQPQFQGQTKERLVSPEAARLVEGAMRDRFELWLGSHPATAAAVLEHLRAVPRSGSRGKKAKEDVGRKSATRKLRLPGKLADCARELATAPSSSSSRAILPAARPSRRATATPRRCCPCAARS